MTEIEKAYREGYTEGAWRELTVDQGWDASLSKQSEEELAQRKEKT